MGYRFNLDAGTGVVHVIFDGDLSDAGMTDAYRDIKQFVSEHEIKAGIIDFSAVTDFRLSSDCIRFMAHHSPLFPDPVRRVIVAPEDLMYGLARMYQEVGSKTRKNLYVARSLSEAFELLAQSDRESAV